MRAGRSASLALVAAIAAGSSASAHRLDECLQAARIAVEADRVTLELDVTPGVAVANAVIADVDRDRDGLVSAAEQQAYTRLVLDSVDLAIDGRPVNLTPGAATFPGLATLQQGEGTIRLRSAVTMARQSTGAHEVRFRNRYHRDISVYLANALVPESDRVAVTAQQHDAQQRELTIAYQVRDEQTRAPAWWLLSGVTAVLALILVRPGRRGR